MPRRRLIFALFLAAHLAACPIPASAQGNEDAELSRHLFELSRHHQGSVALFAENLRTGRTTGFGTETPVRSVSVVKLAILLDAARQIHNGSATLDERLPLTAGNRVGGSGILGGLTSPPSLSVADLLLLMTALSDNTATNTLLDRFPIDEVNQTIAAAGLSQTHLYRKVFLPASQPQSPEDALWGLGRTTPHEAAMLMEDLATCHISFDGAPASDSDGSLCSLLLGMLRQQQDRNSLPRLLDPLDRCQCGTPIANKTGSLDQVRNDVALVATPRGPLIIAAFTWENEDQRWTGDNRAEQLLGRLALAIVNRWSPEGTDASAFDWEDPRREKK